MIRVDWRPAICPWQTSSPRNFTARQHSSVKSLRSAAYLVLVEAAKAFDPIETSVLRRLLRHRIRGALRDYMRYLLVGNWRGDELCAPLFTAFGRNPEHAGRVLWIPEPEPIGTEIDSMDAVEAWLRRLPPKHALACRLIYLGGKTPDEVAALLGLSRSQVSRDPCRSDLVPDRRTSTAPPRRDREHKTEKERLTHRSDVGEQEIARRRSGRSWFLSVCSRCSGRGFEIRVRIDELANRADDEVVVALRSAPDKSAGRSSRRRPLPPREIAGSCGPGH